MSIKNAENNKNSMNWLMLYVEKQTQENNIYDYNNVNKKFFKTTIRHLNLDEMQWSITHFI